MAGLTKEQRAERAAAKAAEQQDDPTISEVQGAPAIEHQKKIQKKLSAEKKIVKPFKQFFTVKDGKLLSVKVKANGAYSTFIAQKVKMEKKEKGSWDAQIRLMKKAGTFVSEDAYQDKVDEIKAELE